LTCGVCNEPVSRSDLALFSPPRPGDTRVSILIAHKGCTQSQVCALLMPTYRSINIATLLDQLVVFQIWI
jgi:hypothetical protein